MPNLNSRASRVRNFTVVDIAHCNFCLRVKAEVYFIQ